MCRSKQMGPDWTEIREYLRLIEQHGECTISLVMQPVGPRAGTDYSVSLCAIKEGCLGKVEDVSVVVAGTWPNASARTLEAFVYQMLHALDTGVASKFFKQSVLPF